MLCIFMNLFIEYIIAYNILMKPGFCGLPSRLNKVKRSKVQESSRAIGKYFFFCSKKRDDYHFFFFCLPYGMVHVVVLFFYYLVLYISVDIVDMQNPFTEDLH